ncbi:MAG: hypothetical protein ABI318_08810, partial [Chthoniobacteraceae bacterium]
MQSLVFSPDGRVLASGEYRTVKLWQRAPNFPQFTLGADPVSAFAASADGKWIATAAKDNVIRIWDAANGKPVKELLGHTGTVNTLRFSQNSARLASDSADKTIRVWDVAAGKIFSQTETANEVAAVASTMGGKWILSAGGEPAIRAWELPAKGEDAWKPLKEFTGHTGPVTCLETFMPDGKQMLSGSADGSVRQWAVDQHRQIRQFDHSAPVSSIAVSPNGKIFASAGGNSARLWSADKGQQLGEMKGDHRARARIGDSERSLAFAKSEVAYWKTTLDAALKTQTAKAEAVKKAGETFANAEKTAKEKREALEKITDAKANPAAEDAVKNAEASRAAADTARKTADIASKDAEHAAAGGLTVATAGDDEVIRTWSAENGAGFDTFPGKLGPVRGLAYTPDGRIVSRADRNGSVVWRAAADWTLARSIGTGDEKSPLANRVLTIEFSADGKLLATGG